MQEAQNHHHHIMATTTKVPLRIATVNALFEDFYVRHSKTATKYPPKERAAAFAAALKQPPLSTADVICFQEFSSEQASLVNDTFAVYLSHNTRRGPSASYIATAFRRSSFLLPPLEVTNVPLEKGGSKALLLTKVVHKPSGRPLLIGNAHVPWSSGDDGFLKYFSLMVDVMAVTAAATATKEQDGGGVSAIFCGDFNADHQVFQRALDLSTSSASPHQQQQSAEQHHVVIKNAIADVPFTSLSPSNKPLKIDHMWYASPPLPTSSKKSGDDDDDDDDGCEVSDVKKQRASSSSSPSSFVLERNAGARTVVVPSDPEHCVRHASKQDGSSPDYGSYFSDHAIVAAEFTLEKVPYWGEPGDLLRVAFEAERKHLAAEIGGGKPTTCDMSASFA